MSDTEKSLAIERDLDNRLKELKCLFRMSELVDYFGYDLEKIVRGIAEIMPESWQYPESTVVSIHLTPHTFESPGFEVTEWMQRAKIKLNGEAAGTITVCYTEEREQRYEGPFLKEERLLLNAVAERLGRIAERIKAKEQLLIEEEALKHKNIAMKEVLTQAKQEKKELAQRIRKNMETIVLPLLDSIEQDFLNTRHEHSLKLLRSNLEEITDPLTSRLSSSFERLSPKEIQICNMIKQGFTTKDIALMKNLSSSTINRHRENIRRKLELKNKSINLIRYLQDNMEESSLD